MMKHWVGAHVSAEKGVYNAIPRILDIKGVSFAFFLKNQKRWTSSPYEEKVVQQFHENIKEAQLDSRKQVLPHASYLINLANPDAEKLEKAKAAMLDDLQRCEQLNIGLYNLHPGSSLGTDKDAAIKQISTSINEMVSKTDFVKIVLENMTGQEARVVGTELSDLQKIIAGVDNKDRVGVCIDTCHSLAAGFDLRSEETFNEFWHRFDKVVGMKYLSAIHMNDSKYPLDSRRDVHQSLGLGFVGLETFRLIMNSPKFEGIPLILETPMETEEEQSRRHDEIELLKWLVGRTKDDPEFIQKQEELSQKGKKERDAVLATLTKRKAAEEAKVNKRALKQASLQFSKSKKVKIEAEETEKQIEKEMTVEIKKEIK